MFFCNDLDLMTWEPGLFLEPAFAHLALFKNVSATLTGTALVTDSAVLDNVLPGMVITVTTSDGMLTQLLEVTEVADATHATLSALRSRASDPPVPPLTGGSVKATLVSFRPQIAAVGDQLLALLGLTSDRDSAPPELDADLFGFRAAATFCTLEALYRTLTTTIEGKPAIPAKHAFYHALAQGARRALSHTADTNNDGTPDITLRQDTPLLERN